MKCLVTPAALVACGSMDGFPARSVGSFTEPRTEGAGKGSIRPIRLARSPRSPLPTVASAQVTCLPLAHQLLCFYSPAFTGCGSFNLGASIWQHPSSGTLWSAPLGQLVSIQLDHASIALHQAHASDSLPTLSQSAQLTNWLDHTVCAANPASPQTSLWLVPHRVTWFSQVWASSSGCCM